MLSFQGNATPSEPGSLSRRKLRFGEKESFELVNLYHAPSIGGMPDSLSFREVSALFRIL